MQKDQDNWQQSKTQKKEVPMPKFYRTPAGRVVAANPSLHRLVTEQSGKYGSYAPCDKDGRVQISLDEGDNSMISADQVADMVEKAKQNGIEQGWAEAKAELGKAIEEAKAEATEAAKAEAASELEAAKAAAFEEGKAAGLAEAKPAPKAKGK